MTDWPRTGCSTIVTQGGKVLLIKRGKQPFEGYWSLPGGAQEPGETLEDCARRELLEETRLSADALNPVGARDRIARNESGDITHHFVIVTFLASAFNGEAVASDDAADIGWFSIDEMRTLEMTPDTLNLLIEVLDLPSE